MKYLLKKALKYIIFSKKYYILAFIFRLLIREKTPQGKDKFYFSNSKKRITILSIDPERHRGDLDSLSTVSKFRILHIKQRWTNLLICTIYKKNDLNVNDFFLGSSDSNQSKEHIKALSLMTGFINALYSISKVDCTVNVNYRYAGDFYWVKSSLSIGVPHIMLYRECRLQKNSRIYDEVVIRHKMINAEYASHIIVHNQTTKDSFIESGYSDGSNITVAGALRMDNYLQKIKSLDTKKNNSNRRMKFVLFYFPYNMSLFGKNNGIPVKDEYSYAYRIWNGREKFFIDFHEALIELSIELPDVDFIIKPKDVMMEFMSWKFYTNILDKSAIKMNANYSIQPYSDVHDLILESDVVCSFQSSTVIEAAISGKPVILPVFDEYRNTPNFNDFFWNRHLDLFDIATSKNHLKDLIKKQLTSPYVPKKVQQQRKEVFELFFDDIKGNALKKYSTVIQKVVNQ
jgi:hypothetical protein